MNSPCPAQVRHGEFVPFFVRFWPTFLYVPTSGHPGHPKGGVFRDRGKFALNVEEAHLCNRVDKASGRCEFTSNRNRDIVSGMALATGDCGLRFPNQNRRLAPSRSGKLSSAARLKRLVMRIFLDATPCDDFFSVDWVR